MKPVGDDPRERLADAEQALWDVARIAKCEVEYPAALWRDLLRMAQDGIDARADAVASRTAHAALVAGLRALHQYDGRHGCTTCLDVDAFPHPWPCETAQVLDRHAPEETA